MELNLVLFYISLSTEWKWRMLTLTTHSALSSLGVWDEAGVAGPEDPGDLEALAAPAVEVGARAALEVLIGRGAAAHSGITIQTQ